MNPRLLAVAGPLKDSTFALPDGEIFLGRDPANFLSISDPSLSRRHCALSRDDDRFPGKDPRYQDLKFKDIPLSECLKDTVARTLPYWHETIAPAVRSGQSVMVAAHGNSLRGLVKYLDNVSDQDIVELNIPTGIPLVYELDDDLNPLQHYYLGDPEAVARAAQAVAEQGKRKE